MTDTERRVLDQSDAAQVDAPQVVAAQVDSGIVWRGLVAVGAILAALAGVPSYVVGALTLLALGSAVERLARRGRGGADSLLVGVAGVLVVVVLTGVALGSTPVGLSTTTWGVALGVVSLGCLAVAVNLPRPTPIPRSDWSVAAKAAPWVLAVVAVSAVAIGMSVRSVGPAEAAPVQMSLGEISGGRVQVEVSASERTGPVELRTTDEDGTEIDYPLFTVAAGSTSTQVVTVPEEGRFVIALVYPDQTQPLRSLILDR